ncbi:PHP domain-containing protein [Picosynechococcus sp. PCC 11901]|uniref:PHP domain-containing protein n=1 Tax=Picosynechococcus sp. PCC 11901 TaxID=2579791 RepID=UPI0010FBCB62|nr:PHP domain-containing protein [Picosynechococcus sp. PCC 11901]QCS49170.1 PHP domain-containing protein [Picosynechococcus sp. PCC 11901]
MTSTLSVPSAAQDLQALEKAWRSLTATSCPNQYNFHMHSVCSDGQLTPAEIVDQAIAIGLKGFAITDHHTLQGYQQAQGYLSRQQNETTRPLPHLWTGIEINGILLDTTVHILAYGFNPDHSAIAPYFNREIPEGDRAAAAVIIDAIHAAGGLAVLAHPARYRRPATELIPAAASLNIDGVEAYYAYDNPKPWVPSQKHTPVVAALGHRHNLWLTCGTDTHGRSLQQRL